MPRLLSFTQTFQGSLASSQFIPQPLRDRARCLKNIMIMKIVIPRGLFLPGNNSSARAIIIKELLLGMIFKTREHLRGQT